MAGSVLAFWNSRYLLKNWVQNWIGNKPKFIGLNLALSHNSRKLVALLRLSPGVPYYILNCI